MNAPSPYMNGLAPRKDEPSPRKSRLVWLAILLLALGLRLPLAFAGFPYIHYVDEGHVLHPVMGLLKSGSWDPQWHLYPSLPFYAIAGAAWVYSPVYSLVHDRPLWEDLSPFPPKIYDLVAPAEVLMAGRLVTLAFSLGVVVLTGLLAGRVTGSRTAGLFAALAAAVAPALVIRGATVTVDPFTTFFTVAAVYFAEGAARGSRSWRDAILAGLMIGCALTSKYTGLLVCIPVALTLLRIGDGWRPKARAVELAALASLVAAAVTMPALFLRNQQVLESLARHATGYQAVTMGSYWEQAVKRAEWDHPFEHPELGLPFLILMALGWIVAMWDRHTRATAAAWTLYAAVMLALFTSFSAQPFRNLLPLVPFACVLVAVLVVRLRRRMEWMAAVLLLALFLPAEIAYARDRAGLVDSRVEAVEWLARHRRPDEALLIAMELPILPGEAGKLPGKVLVMSQRQAVPRLIRRRDVQMVVTGIFRWKEPDLRKALNEGRTRARYRQVATFGEKPGTGIWRGNRQRVLIYRRVARNQESSPPTNLRRRHPPAAQR